MAFSKWFTPTAVALGMSALSVATLIIGLSNSSASALPEQSILKIISLLLFLITGASIAYWGLYAFTGRAEERHDEMVKFTYFVMVIALTLTALPPLITEKPIGNEPVGLISGCVRVGEDKSLLNCKGDAPPYTNNQWMLNLGGTITGQNGTPKGAGSVENRAIVDGGIAVPFPFLILALFGGAISLSRRVPEIQKRADAGYVSTADAPKLSCADLREKLLFQVVQFISAPMIAVVAYQAFKPGSETAAAALAFMCGFGSETVLLMVRSLMDGIKPRAAASTSVGSVRGGIMFGQAIAAGAQLSVAGTSRSATSDQVGNYDISDVPAGMQTIEATYGGQTKSISLMVAGGSATICNIDLAPALSQAVQMVQLRIGVKEGVDDGSVTLSINGKPERFGPHGLLEVEVEANKEQVIEVTATSGGRPVSDKLTFIPLPSDDARSIELNPA